MEGGAGKLKKLLIFFGCFLLCSCEHPCKQGHYEMRHVDTFTTMIFAGKVMVPIVCPEHDEEVFICDEYYKEGEKYEGTVGR